LHTLAGPSLATARRWLFVTWFTGIFLIVTFFAAQTLFGVFGDDVMDAWGWLTPHIAPSVSVILSGYVATALQQEPEDVRIAKPWIFMMALGWSVGYLLLVFSVIFFERLFPENIFVIHQSSNAFLGIVQGIVSAFLAVFFMAGQKSIDASANRQITHGETSRRKNPRKRDTEGSKPA